MRSLDLFAAMLRLSSFAIFLTMTVFAWPSGTSAESTQYWDQIACLYTEDGNKNAVTLDADERWFNVNPITVVDLVSTLSGVLHDFGFVIALYKEGIDENLLIAERYEPHSYIRNFASDPYGSKLLFRVRVTNDGTPEDKRSRRIHLHAMLFAIPLEDACFYNTFVSRFSAALPPNVQVSHK